MQNWIVEKKHKHLHHQTRITFILVANIHPKPWHTTHA
jgi:hypothetical protein